LNTSLREGEFAFLAHALEAWPDLPASPDDTSTPVARLIHAARAASEEPHEVGASDLAVLLRHVLRADAELTGASNGLRVPDDEPWPRDHEWADFGLRATAERLVFADEWRPDWLTDSRDPCASAFRGCHTESLGDIPAVAADPFFEKVAGVSHYRSTGQREAIRAVVATPPTATLIGNLPTGSGKSLVAYVPALMADRPGTTIVVIPTTSLAIDQERAFLERIAELPDRARFPRELAFHGESPESTRLAIKERLARGTQGIVFTSPESLSTALLTAAYAASDRGYLTAFVIDEAHIVSQWGQEFRPAFQALAGVRGDLLRAATAAGAPFRTILLSATLTEESLLILQSLFGRPGPTELISSVALRCEPSYWLARTQDDHERAQFVAECVRHLPRPLVLYTTKVADAEQWHERLRAEGFRRTMLVAGKTEAEDRKVAIQRLRAGSLDVVVGTSAFGLGIDQPDLRSVVHACIPETIDRYYQEVGRGGRDGLPSIAVLVSTPQDKGVADGLSRRKLISLERGFERWGLMHTRGEGAGHGLLKVPLWTAPADLRGDNPETRSWNLRTLLLMDRGGLITLQSSPPPRQGPEESAEAWEARAPGAFDEYAAHAILRIREGNLADRELWERAVGEARDEAIDADRTARAGMDEALESEADLCSLFAATYGLQRHLPGIPEEQLPVPVAPSCGGCPGCRAAGKLPRRYPAPTPRPAASLQRSWAPTIRRWFGGQRVLVVVYEPERSWHDACVQACERLARLGLWCLAAPPEFMSLPRVRALHKFAPHRAVFLLERWDSLRAPRLPTALVYGPEQHVPAHALMDSGPERVVLVATSAKDPRHPTATVGEYHTMVTTIHDVLERI
jgi:superfamily II DNA/RNA helicase